MSSSVLTPENQIQRLNLIFNKVETLQTPPFHKLTIHPHKKSWNVLEILEHLNIAYSFYEENIDTVLNTAPESTKGPWAFRPRAWQRIIIEGQRPKGDKRPFKIKTLKRFRPILAQGRLPEDRAADIFDRFRSNYGHLKQSILTSRYKVMKSQKITSAIGPLVRFYLPEAFEFLICHAERHMVQIDEILSQRPMN